MPAAIDMQDLKAPKKEETFLGRSQHGEGQALALR